MCAFSFRECNHTRTEREHLASTVLATHSLHQQLLQRKWQTRENGKPEKGTLTLTLRGSFFSCKQQAVTLVFKAPHHFWWAVSKQKQGSIPEPKRTQVVLRWHARARTHTHNLQASCHYTYDCSPPHPHCGTQSSVRRLLHMLCATWWKYAGQQHSFYPSVSVAISLVQMSSNWAYIELSGVPVQVQLLASHPWSFWFGKSALWPESLWLS